MVREKIAKPLNSNKKIKMKVKKHENKLNPTIVIHKELFYFILDQSRDS